MDSHHIKHGFPGDKGRFLQEVALFFHGLRRDMKKPGTKVRAAVERKELNVRTCRYMVNKMQLWLKDMRALHGDATKKMKKK